MISEVGVAEFIGRVAHLLKDGEEKAEPHEGKNFGQTVVCAC